jgi:sugar phosphate isomerase/epimerase
MPRHRTPQAHTNAVGIRFRVDPITDLDGSGVYVVPVGDGVTSPRCYDDFRRSVRQEGTSSGSMKPQPAGNGVDNVVGRALGTMITYGFPEIELEDELALAERFGARVLEILPEWSRLPDPVVVRDRAAARGLLIHSAHGCWGSRTIRAARIDLGAPDPPTQRESVDDLKTCVDWLHAADGTCLVVHPGGLSDPAEREPRLAALARGLHALAEHSASGGIRICVENMPPGVHPGSRMAELADLLAELNHPSLALALDTGHANLTATVVGETRAAGALLATTHVHDNDGTMDTHEPPGLGTIDWAAWGEALDGIAYSGPIMLECIRYLRRNPSHFRPGVLRTLLGNLASEPTRQDRSCG